MNFFEYLSQNLTYLFIVIGAIVVIVAACFLVKPIEKLLNKISGKLAEKKKNKENSNDEK